MEELLSKHQVSVLQALTAIFDLAIKKAYPDLEPVEVIITPSTSPKFGDYQCNNSLSLAKKISTDGNKVSPQQVAKKICESLVKDSIIEKFEIAGPGFINIYISRQFVEAEVSKIVRFGVSMPPPQRRLKCIVDMSSPNIAKDMHVGHLR